MAALKLFYYAVIAFFLMSFPLVANGAFAQMSAPTVFQPGEHAETFDYVGSKGGINIYHLGLEEPPLDLDLVLSKGAANILTVSNRKTGVSTVFPIKSTQAFQTKDKAPAFAVTPDAALELIMQTPGGSFVHAAFVSDVFIGFMIVQTDGQVDFITP